MTLSLLDKELPTHPTTGLRALGLRKDGRPIWPILGGAEDGDGDGDTSDGDDDGDGSDGDAGDGDGSDGDKPLGPAGTKALEAEKTKRRAAQAELRRFKELGLSPEQIKALVGKDGDGDKPDAEQIRREAEREALNKASDRLKRAAAVAAAAGKLANPKLAPQLLDLSGIEVDDDGNVDEDEIADAIDDLLKREPYLAAQGGGRRFNGTGDGGPRGEGRKAQLTQADLERMSPAEINKARKEGRLDQVLGKK